MRRGWSYRVNKRKGGPSASVYQVSTIAPRHGVGKGVTW
jgi:hypothetical protein